MAASHWPLYVCLLSTASLLAGENANESADEVTARSKDGAKDCSRSLEFRDPMADGGNMYLESIFDLEAKTKESFVMAHSDLDTNVRHRLVSICKELRNPSTVFSSSDTRSCLFHIVIQTVDTRRRV
ncbi:hypothetical protein ACTXT7_006964 [Hymenolepis weldensis]